MAKGKKAAAKATASKKPKTHSISEDGCTVTRHHKDGDSVQIFDNPGPAKQYAASIK